MCFKFKKRLAWIPAILVLLIVMIGALLRLHHLATVPGWYPDEGSNIAIAASLSQGEVAYLAFGQSSFINPRPYLFYLPLVVLFKLGGVDILWARLLSALCGLLSLLLLYPLVRVLVDRRTAWLAASFYAVYPAAVVYSRLAFTYNLLAPLYLLGLYTFHRYLESSRIGWLLASALCGGLALITDLAGIAFPLFLVLALLVHRPRHLPFATPPLLLPVLIWGVWMWIEGGEAFLFDLRFTLSRTGGSLGEQLARIVFFYRAGLEGELWLALGSLGLLFLPDRRSRWLLGGLHFGSLLLLTRTGAIFGLASYFLIPLFPLVAIGMAWLMAHGLPSLVRVLEREIKEWLAARCLRPSWPRRLAFVLTSAILFFVILSPFVSMVYEGLLLDYSLFTVRLGTTLADPLVASQVAAYVNARTTPDDVVLCSPTIAWLFHAHAADFQMAIAATGQATQHFPAGIPFSRFRFDPRLENASYVIVDPLWRGWASTQMPKVAEIVQEVESGWVLEGRFGEFEVYRHPSLKLNCTPKSSVCTSCL
jgi:4-amino-4-deoxy-L-arabinose transferase-like glycosyltransferase